MYKINKMDNRTKTLILSGAIFPAIYAQQSTPNIIIMLADDLGYADVSINNPEAYAETPNLERLAAEGAVFTQCYSSAPMSSPSRGGLLTGRVPLRLGIHDWIKDIYKLPKSNIHLQSEETTIPEVLKKVGYQTATIGKWHLNNGFNTGNGSNPNEQGFDYSFSTPVQSEPSHCNPTNFYENGVAVGKIGNDMNPVYSSDIVADKTIEWLNGRKKEKPFMLYVAFHEPHVVCDAPEKLKAKYLKKIKDGLIPKIEGSGGDGLGQAEYYACIENMDKAIGKIIGQLEKHNLLENTLIFFSSDNGPDTGRRYKGRLQSVGSTKPFKGRKRWLFEGGVHQIGVAYWKNTIDGGTRINKPVGHVDLLPTIADLCGACLPEKTLDGENILPLFDGNSNWDRTKPLHWHFHSPLGDSPQSVMRKGDFVVTADWNTRFKKGRFDLDFIEGIKSAELKNFKVYKHNNGVWSEIDNGPALYPLLIEELKNLHTEAKNECPDRSHFEWNQNLENIVQKEYPTIKEW